MRIIGPPDYKPWPPFTSDSEQCRFATEARLRNDRMLRRRTAQRAREARLRCPECGDSLKVRHRGAWTCRHCLARMVDTAHPG
jgi:ribosomal protein L37AE/L43A